MKNRKLGTEELEDRLARMFEGKFDSWVLVAWLA